MNDPDDSSEQIGKALQEALPEVASFLDAWLWPVSFALLLFGLVTLAMRTASKLLGKLVNIAGKTAVTIVGALVLLPELAVASSLRATRLRLPRTIYLYGDTVTVAAAALNRLITAMASQLSQASKARFFLTILVTVVIFRWWNDGACATAHGDCISPVQEWLAYLDD